jgi:hypothetical protein
MNRRRIILSTIVAILVCAVLLTGRAAAVGPNIALGVPLTWQMTDANGVVLSISLSAPAPEPTPSATATATPVPPTATATATPAPTSTTVPPSPTATATPLPPAATATATPTATAIPPIATPVPPTATPTVVVVANCLGVPAYPEIRPTNVKANNTPGGKLDPRHREWITGFGPYYDKVDGLGCLGTTEQILEWAAIKWELHRIPGSSKDLMKAVAVRESDWYQLVQGDMEECTATWCFPSPGFYGKAYQSYGITGIKRTAWANTWNKSHVSTAFAADFYAAAFKAYYDGAIPWAARTKGDIWRSIGAWYCGCDNATGIGIEYAATVRDILGNRNWTQPYFKDVGCSTNCAPSP